jgi:hypothetical protein
VFGELGLLGVLGQLVEHLDGLLDELERLLRVAVEVEDERRGRDERDRVIPMVVDERGQALFGGLVVQVGQRDGDAEQDHVPVVGRGRLRVGQRGLGAIDRAALERLAPAVEDLLEVLRTCHGRVRPRRRLEGKGNRAQRKTLNACTQSPRWKPGAHHS